MSTSALSIASGCGDISSTVVEKQQYLNDSIILDTHQSSLSSYRNSSTFYPQKLQSFSVSSIVERDAFSDLSTRTPTPPEISDDNFCARADGAHQATEFANDVSSRLSSSSSTIGDRYDGRTTSASDKMVGPPPVLTIQSTSPSGNGGDPTSSSSSSEQSSSLTLCKFPAAGQSTNSAAADAGNAVAPTRAAQSIIKPTMLSSMFQQTRHARRIYVGNIPPAYSDDEMLKSFLNSMISKGLGEENDNSYVLSLYVNQKKCFAFVELKSIELTTACLDLDGLLYNSSVLRILRANEYKPELLPPSHYPPIKLNLPPNAFGTLPLATSHQQPAPLHSPTSSNDPRLDYSFIKLCPVGAVEKDFIAIIGFPYDESARRFGGHTGCSVGPKAIRNALRRSGGAGSLINPEFGIDLRAVQIVDVGDVPPGLPIDEAYSRLASAVMELLYRGAIPFVLGGSSEQSYCVAAGLMAVAGGSIGVVNVSAHLDVKPTTGVQDSKSSSFGSSYRQLLDDARFCPPCTSLSANHSCDGRLVVFGAQGSLCSADHADFVTDRGGQIIWLSKDLRQVSVDGCASSLTPKTHSSVTRPSSAQGISLTTTPTVAQHFKQVLKNLGENYVFGTQRPVHASFNASAICGTACPGSVHASETSLGLTADEVLEMAMLAGADPNVVTVDLCDLVPEIEEARSARLFADIFYRFVAGVVLRRTVASSATQPPMGVQNLQNEQRAQLQTSQLTRVPPPPRAPLSSQPGMPMGVPSSAAPGMMSYSSQPTMDSIPADEVTAFSCAPPPGLYPTEEYRAGYDGSDDCETFDPRNSGRYPPPPGLSQPRHSSATHEIQHQRGASGMLPDDVGHCTYAQDPQQTEQSSSSAVHPPRRAGSITTLGRVPVVSNRTQLAARVGRALTSPPISRPHVFDNTTVNRPMYSNYYQTDDPMLPEGINCDRIDSMASQRVSSLSKFPPADADMRAFCPSRAVSAILDSSAPSFLPRTMNSGQMGASLIPEWSQTSARRYIPGNGSGSSTPLIGGGSSLPFAVPSMTVAAASRPPPEEEFIFGTTTDNNDPWRQ